MKEVRDSPPGGPWTDRVGAVASTLCALHCLFCAFAPFVFGALGLGFLLSSTAEWALTLCAVAFGAGALALGRRRHGSTRVAALLGLGIVGLLGARALEMGSGHHGDHVDAEHLEERHGASAERHDDRTATGPAATTDGHEEAESDSDHAHEHDEGALHTVGGTVGFAAGLLLLAGHLLNVRAARRRREPPPEWSSPMPSGR